ncbi:MAG: hypothetical protein N2691_04830, partial [Patescibacteria group bacterium]|nr:hypothetical protein [Patescibacteria group bacterium]
MPRRYRARLIWSRLVVADTAASVGLIRARAHRTGVRPRWRTPPRNLTTRPGTLWPTVTVRPAVCGHTPRPRLRTKLARYITPLIGHCYR